MRKIQIGDKQYAELRILNARKIELKSSNYYPEITKKGNEITSVGYNTEVISVGDVVEIDNSGILYKYNIKIIEDLGGGNFILYQTILTKTSRLLFPLITIGNAKQYFYNEYFYNAYLYCNKYPQFNDEKHLFVLYRFFNHKPFLTFEPFVKTHINLKKQIDIKSDLVLYIFRIPDIFLKEVTNFTNGNYLEYSDFSIDKICTFFENSKTEIAIQVLKNDLGRRRNLEKELGCKIPKEIATFSKPVINEETLIL